MIIPKLAALHDLSCVGRCSLSVIMPILSNMQVQVCPLPTAVLSSHLGGYSNVASVDCTDNMQEIYTCWQKENISFDCLYTGYLDSHKQIDVVKDFLQKFKTQDTLVAIDPVMGDNGRLYSKYTSAMQQKMRELIVGADIITPNYTEACFLLNEQYQTCLQDENIIFDYLLRLADFAIEKVVITGIPLGEDCLVNMAYDKATGVFLQAKSPKLPVHYPGTGDIFTCVLLGYLLKDFDLGSALHGATEFVYKCIDLTYKNDTSPREGVLFEAVIGEIY